MNHRHTGVDFTFQQTEGREVLLKKIHTAPNMAGGILGAGAFVIVAVLQVSRIVQQGRHQPLVNLTRGKMNSRFTRTMKEPDHGQKTIGDVLQVVIIGVAAFGVFPVSLIQRHGLVECRPDGQRIRIRGKARN